MTVNLLKKIFGTAILASTVLGFGITAPASAFTFSETNTIGDWTYSIGFTGDDANSDGVLSYSELLDLTATLSHITFRNITYMNTTVRYPILIDQTLWTIADISEFDWVMDGSEGTSIYLSNRGNAWFQVYDSESYMDLKMQYERWQVLTGEKQEDGSWNYSEGSFGSDPVYITSGAEPEILAGVEPEITAQVPEPASVLGLLAVGALGAGAKFKKQQQG